MPCTTFLQTNYQPKSKPHLPQLLKTLSRLRLDNFASVSDYDHKFVSVETEMELMRPNGISQTVVNTIFLEGLDRKWKGFKQRMIGGQYRDQQVHLGSIARFGRGSGKTMRV